MYDLPHSKWLKVLRYATTINIYFSEQIEAMDFFKDVKKADLYKVQGFTYKGYEDYIAARCLYSNNLLEQATSLANTCIEKMIKALLFVCDGKMKFTHHTPDLLEELRKYLPLLANRINSSYLDRIYLVHEFRYLDTLDKLTKINYFISRNYFLAELDYSYAILKEALVVENAPPPATQSEPDKLLAKNNWVVLDIDKKDIFDGQDYITATIRLPNTEMYRMVHTRPTHEFYSDFALPGIVVEGSRLRFQTPEGDS